MRRGHKHVMDMGKHWDEERGCIIITKLNK